MLNRSFNRPIVIVSFMCLSGFIVAKMGEGTLTVEAALAILGLASNLALGYINIKGNNGSK